MKESKFYDIVEEIDECHAPEDLGNYYPKAEELQILAKENKTEDVLPILAFMAKDPYKDDEKIVNRPDYREAVSAAKKLVTTMPLEDD